MVTEIGSPPSKGWVRDGILSILTKGPRTTSEIAKELGVSKATVSYHMKSLIRRDMTEIADIKSIRGGVYSKTYSLKRSGLTLAGRRIEQEHALAELDEWFEKILMSWHLDSRRRPGDEIEIFLYHLFRLLAQSNSLDQSIFEEFGSRAGSLLVAPSLRAKTMKVALKELSTYLSNRGMAEVNAELRKAEDQRLVCAGCFENRQHGSLVCFFTKGLLTGAIGANRGGRPHLEWSDNTSGVPACTFRVITRGSKA